MQRSTFFGLALVLTVSSASGSGDPEPAPNASALPSALCFAPGTPPDVVQRHAERQVLGSFGHSLSAPPATKFQFDDTDRWSSTATDGSGLDQGDPITLTWSIVPDGTSIFGYNGEPTSDSDLRAFFDSIYGAEAVWLPIFEQVFDRWSELTGVRYVYEPNDDGSAWTPFSIAGGQLGVRGDIRISGHPLDGNSGVLAYNFFPNTGDMVLDTSDSFYTSTHSNSLGLRNTLAHEHGHGLGLSHVCPVAQTKLMEPFISFAFDGPQHDDILAVNRGYGDQDEDNDSAGTATPLGTVTNTLTLTDRSIDDNSDVDFYSFDAGAGTLVSVTLTPVGSTYTSGSQTMSCNTGSSFNSLAIHDLSFLILDSDGSTELANVDAASTGAAEVLPSFFLPSGAGTYYIGVNGDATNTAQLYQLEVEIESAEMIFADGFESGNTSRWN